MRYADGSRYEGGWSGGLRDGEGRMRYPDGTSYKGGWERGLKDGYGVHTYLDPQTQGYGTYVGYFATDRRHGEGTYTYPNGYVQSGTWRDDSFAGKVS
jgi:hypothetical protein